MSGLLVGGKYYAVPGVTVISPGAGAPSWCKLDPGDYTTRPAGSWVRQIIQHTTKGEWPQTVLTGVGPAHREQLVADFWRSDPQHSAAQLVTSSDGVVACLADLLYAAAYHATVSNLWSVGWETYQERGGGVYQAAWNSTAIGTIYACRALGVQLQVPRLPYANAPLRRMLDGGKDVVGVLGHRDNTDRRGRGDPGDEMFLRLRTLGAEAFDFDAGEDLRVWKERQADLNSRGARLTVDGVPGPATVRALRAEGYVDGIFALGKAA